MRKHIVVIVSAVYIWRSLTNLNACMRILIPIKSCLLTILFTVFTASGICAQQTFLLKNASKIFDVKIRIAECENDICEGKATVYILEKDSSSPVQTLLMPNLYLELNEDRKPTANLIELYGMNNSGVIFDDFNFDGAEDLALRNGNEGAYGGPSYDVFLAAKPNNKFIKNAALTKLASENLGMFELDKKRKTVETSNKSGCCWHQTNRYKVVGNRPVKVYVFTEDAANGGEQVKLTTETLVRGKWKKTVKHALKKDYYKEQ